MREKLTHLPKPVMRTILAFYRRKRVYEFLRALLAPLVGYAVLALIATHVDRFLFLETPARLWISGATHGLTLLIATISLGAFAWRRLSVRRLAYEMERMLPKTAAERLVTLDDVLTRAADGHPADSVARAALVEQLTGETVALCEGTPHAARLARDRRLKRRTVALALLALVWAGLLALPSYQAPLMLQRLTAPTRNLPKPSFMRLNVTPESAIVGRGGEVMLRVQVEGDIPRLLQRPLRWLGADADRCLLATATGKVERLSITADARPMSREQRRRFVATRNELQESFSYRIRCGDAQTDIRLVRVVAQPRATGVGVEVEPPAYTGLKTARFTDLRDPVPAFAGSRVRLSFAADQSPVKVRLLGLRDGKTLAELEPDPKTGTYLHEFTMADAIEMEVVLVNELNFKNTERVRLSMELRTDQAPGVRLEYPAGELTAVQGELVPIQVELTDDLGLREGAICFQINPDRNPGVKTSEILLPVKEKSLSQTLSENFDLAKADVVPGDEVVLWIRARDTGDTDESSPPVRIHVTAFAGNDNERRRVAALRLLAQALLTAESSAANPAVLVLNEAAYEPVGVSAKAQGFTLNARPTPESLLEFLEREHHFTDSAEAAEEVRWLHGVIFGLFRRPSSPAANPAACRQLASETLPSLLRERMARDLMRRALNLRSEARATVSGDGTTERKHRASDDRRVDLLTEALVDVTGAELATLARMSPRELKVEDVRAFNGQISRACSELKKDSARLQAGKTLCTQIDGWIRLLLPALPEWKTQRESARATLRAQYNQLRESLGAATQAGSPTASGEAAGWLATDARLVERSPFLGLGDRLATAAPGGPGAINSRTNIAFVTEARLLSRAALDNDFADWLAGVRVTPAERRLAAALKTLDLVDSTAARTAAVERLRTLIIEDEPSVEVAAEPPPAFFGLNAQLPALTAAATALPEPHDKAMEDQAARTSKLLEGLAKLSPPAEGGAMPDFAPVLNALEAGLVEWESDTLRLSYRIHLDLAYGDPSREQIPRLGAALAGLRAALGRYQTVVPPSLGRMRDRARKSSKAENLAALTIELEGLTGSVNALGSGLKRTAKQLRGEEPCGKESEAVREMRLYCIAARKVAETNDPAAVAAAFFFQHPAAASLVIETKTPLLRELRARLQTAAGALRTGTAADAAFRDAMMPAVRLAGEFQQLLERFKALDANGAVVALAKEIRNRATALVSSERQAGADTLSRDRLAMDDLSRQAEQLEYLARELVSLNQPAAPASWRGAPAGVWNGAARRDAEHARRRIIARFDRARREVALGFDVILTQASQPGTQLPDAPLAGALFAWRTLLSSLGGETVVISTKGGGGDGQEQLKAWLLGELEKTEKALRRTEGVGRSYREPTSRYVESAKGFVRR